MKDYNQLKNDRAKSQEAASSSSSYQGISHYSARQ
jgi:hypothetical protein